MMPYEAIEIMGRERREALLVEAKNNRLGRLGRRRRSRVGGDRASARAHGR